MYSQLLRNLLRQDVGKNRFDLQNTRYAASFSYWNIPYTTKWTHSLLLIILFHYSALDSSYADDIRDGMLHYFILPLESSIILYRSSYLYLILCNYFFSFSFSFSFSSFFEFLHLLSGLIFRSSILLVICYYYYFPLWTIKIKPKFGN